MIYKLLPAGKRKKIGKKCIVYVTSKNDIDKTEVIGYLSLSEMRKPQTYAISADDNKNFSSVQCSGYYFRLKEKNDDSDTNADKVKWYVTIKNEEGEIKYIGLCKTHRFFVILLCVLLCAVPITAGATALPYVIERITQKADESNISDKNKTDIDNTVPYDDSGIPITTVDGESTEIDMNEMLLLDVYSSYTCIDGDSIPLTNISANTSPIVYIIKDAEGKDLYESVPIMPGKQDLNFIPSEIFKKKGTYDVTINIYVQDGDESTRSGYAYIPITITLK